MKKYAIEFLLLVSTLFGCVTQKESLEEKVERDVILNVERISKKKKDDFKRSEKSDEIAYYDKGIETTTRINPNPNDPLIGIKILLPEGTSVGGSGDYIEIDNKDNMTIGYQDNNDLFFGGYKLRKEDNKIGILKKPHYIIYVNEGNNWKKRVYNINLKYGDKKEGDPLELMLEKQVPKTEVERYFVLFDKIKNKFSN